jgi:hypothetical protein
MTSYLGSLGMGAASDDSEVSPQVSSSNPVDPAGGSSENQKLSKESANSDAESQDVADSGTSTATPPPEPPPEELSTAEPEEEPVPIDKYRDMIMAMYTKLPNPIQYEQNYLGEDSTSYVLDAGDGNVVKVAKGDEGYDGWHDDIDPMAEHNARVETVEALQRGKGVEGLEQLVTYGSLDPNTAPLAESSDLIIITQKVSGETLGSMDDGGRAAIPVEHYEKFIDTLKAMSERDIVIRPDPDTIVYDPETGFTATDYTTVESRMTQFEPEPSTAEDVAVSFGSPDAGTLVQLDIAPTSVPQHALKYHDAVQRKLGDSAAARYQQKFGNLWPQA